MTLVTAHLGPVASIIAPVASGTLLMVVAGVFPVPALGTVANRMPTGAVVALVAGHVAPAPAIIVAVAITAIQGAEILDKGTVSVF